MENKIETTNKTELNYYDNLRYEGYKRYELSHGVDPKIFELPAITQIIEDIIVNGDKVVKSEGRSPIRYSDANEDGTFDIYGRMGGNHVTLCYKMELCHDENPEHFIVLTKYDTKTQLCEIGFIFDGIGYQKIYINRDGNIVEETAEVILGGFSPYISLIDQLVDKKLIKAAN